MSGPLASWTLEHTPKGLGTRRRAVLMKLALRANHDGSDADVSIQSIVADLEVSPRTARADLAELEKRGLVELVEQGRAGAGHVTRRRVVVRWCENACRLCELLAEQQQRSIKGPQGTVSRPDEPQVEKGPPGDRFLPAPASEKGPSNHKKGPSAQKKGPQGSPPRTTKDGSPLKGEPSGHHKSDDRGPLRSANGSAARSGSDRQKRDNPEPVAAVIPEESRLAIAALKRESLLRRHGLGPPAPAEASPRARPAAAVDQAPAEASAEAGPQVAGAAAAGQEATTGGDVDQVVIPVEDPADVLYPSDDLGAVAGPCVICEQACTSLHRVSGQVRHATCRDPAAQPAA